MQTTSGPFPFHAIRAGSLIGAILCLPMAGCGKQAETPAPTVKVDPNPATASGGVPGPILRPQDQQLDPRAAPAPVAATAVFTPQACEHAVKELEAQRQAAVTADATRAKAQATSDLGRQEDALCAAVAEARKDLPSDPSQTPDPASLAKLSKAKAALEDFHQQRRQAAEAEAKRVAERHAADVLFEKNLQAFRRAVSARNAKEAQASLAAMRQASSLVSPNYLEVLRDELARCAEQ